MNAIFEEVRTSALEHVPTLFAALAVLIVGWLAALAIASITRRALRRTRLDQRIARWIVGEEAMQRLDT